MARRRISVERIKEVIRYGVTTELSERAIGRALKVSRTTVTKYLECASAAAGGPGSRRRSCPTASCWPCWRAIAHRGRTRAMSGWQSNFR